MAAMVLGTLGSMVPVVGPVLGMVGALVGSMIDKALFGPKPKDVQGPRMQDLAVSHASYGTPIPICYGTMRSSGAVLWSSDIIETTHKKKVKGGKGGGKSSTQTTYTYSINMAVALGEREIVEVQKIWLASKLFYDNGAFQSAVDVRVYTGTLTQTPDSLIQSYEGIDNTPAFIKTAYVVLQGVQLADYGNAMPQFSALVKWADDTVSTVLVDLCERANVPLGSVSELSKLVVRGFGIGSNTNTRAAIETLLTVYDVIGANAIDGPRFIRRDRGARGGIDDAVYGAYEGDPVPADAVKLKRVNDEDLPRSLTVVYIDPARDYQEGAARASRQVGNANTNPVYTFPVVMTAGEAKQLAEKLLFDSWTRRLTFEDLNLPPTYQFIRAGDVYDMKLEGAWYRTRISHVSMGVNGVVTLGGFFEDSTQFTSAAIGSTSQVMTQVAGVAPDSIFTPLDLPILREEDDDPGFYYVIDTISPALHRGSVLLRSSDDVVYEAQDTIGDTGITGSVTNILFDGVWHVMDETNVLQVTLTSVDDQLTSVTQDQVDRGENWCAVGSTTGGWEVLGFRTATQITAGVYHLSGLKRARLGTDWKLASHVAGEKFVLLTGSLGIGRLFDGAAMLNQNRYYKAVTINQEDAAATAIQFQNTGVSKKPLSPTFIQGVLTLTGDFDITWLRRTRIPFRAFTNSLVAPTEEPVEKYQIEFLDGLTVVRTSEIVGPPAFTYTVAMQVADFGTQQTSVVVRIAQRGYSEILGYQSVGELPTASEIEGVAYVVWNASDKAPNHTISGDSLVLTSTTTSAGYTTALNGQRSQGKYYLEFEVMAIGTGSGAGQSAGLTNALAANNTAPSTGTGWDVKAAGDGNLVEEATDWGNINTGPIAWVAGDVISMAWDADADLVWFRINGAAWDNNADDPVTLVGGRTTVGGGNPLYISWDTTNTDASVRANFGSLGFVHAVPTGFKPGLRLDEVGRIWSMWSASDKSASLSVSQGNQLGTVGAAAYHGVRGDQSVSSTKVYVEVVMGTVTANSGIGVSVAAAGLTVQLGSTGDSIAYRPDGSVALNGATVSTLASYVTGDVIGIAINAVSRDVWFRKNGGNWNNDVANSPAANVGGIDVASLSGPLFVTYISDTSGDSAVINSGSAAYRATAPSGFDQMYT